MLVTKKYEETAGVFDKLSAQGLNVVYFPTIKITPTVVEAASLSQSVLEADYIIFTSGNAVKFFMEEVRKFASEEYLQDKIICAVGQKTAKVCGQYSLNVHLTPVYQSAAGLFDELKDQNIASKKFLIPTSRIAGDELKLLLENVGAQVNQITVYDNVLPNQDDVQEFANGISSEKPDMFVFTSPSSYNNFNVLMKIENIQSYFENAEVIPIGGTTASAIESDNVKVALIPEEFSLDGIANEIEKMINNKKKDYTEDIN
ncbi:MAG: uroporphyrinogen-III synthase [Bacteroidota bacterium]